MSTLLVSQRNFESHATPTGHPELPDRLRAIEAALRAARFNSLLRRDAPSVDLGLAELVHGEHYLQQLRRARPAEGMGQLDEETKAGFHPRWIAPIVTWLASEESAEVTGRIFQVSGRELAIAEGWHRGPTTEPTDDPTEIGAKVAALMADARPNADMAGNDKQ